SSPGGILSARATVPLKPLSPKTEMVAVADFVVYTPAGDVAVIAKSCCLKLKEAVVECASEAFAQVLARVYVDASSELHDPVAVHCSVCSRAWCVCPASCGPPDPVDPPWTITVVQVDE